MEGNKSNPNPFEKGISVVICCFNSSERLPETLKKLALQKVKEYVLWEVIVVDNASYDETSKVAEEEWNKYQVNAKLRIVKELKQGLVYARQKGIEASSYSLILFCDDDNHLEEDYIQVSYELMDAKPEVGILGGKSLPKFSGYPGSWVKSFYTALAIGTPAENDDYVKWVFGAGMVVRKIVFKVLKEKGIMLQLCGRNGKKQTFGDDAEMCLAAEFVGYKVFYSSKLIFHHAISKKRLTRKSFISANYKNVFSMVYLFILENLVDRKNVSVGNLYKKFFKRTTKHIMYSLPRCFVGNHKFYSFIMLYTNIQYLFWLLSSFSSFKQQHKFIKNNLYQENGKSRV